MTKLVWSVCALAAIAVVFSAGTATAQGVTSAAVAGRVTDDAGAPVASAVVAISNPSTGQRYSRRSTDDGRYNFESVEVGGPYTLEIRALGFESARSAPFQLALGQRLEVSLRLKRAPLEVAPVTITAESDPLMSRSRSGAQTSVSDSAIHRLPSLSRNFTDFIQTVPQVTSFGGPGSGNGPIIGGQNNRFNNIQIDGGVNNDVFGLASSGTPGGQANAHPISIEAVREYQVLLAPYDVRQGSFTGGLVNAVTKSGTNQWHGSTFGYYQNQGLVGNDTSGKGSTDFTQGQYGLSLGGPIIRDRVRFFGATDLQSRNAPFSGQQIGSNPAGGLDSVGVGITQATADSVQAILRRAYGFDPGSWQSPTLGNPDHNYFGKINAQLAPNSQLELSHNWVDASQDNLIHNSTQTGFRDGYQLSNSGYQFGTITHTTRAKLTQQLSSVYSNELLLGYQTIRDKRQLPNRVPLILVGGDRAGTNVAAGADRFSQANSLDQDIYEVTDNLTIPVGAHLVTIGTHNEFFHFHNVFFPASIGVWSFANIDSLRKAVPFRFERALPGPLRPDGPTADFHVRQYGGYIQDEWSPRPGLTVTAGLRVDVPTNDKPVTNPVLDTSVLKINTGAFPSGNALWSPRAGFNYDVRGDGTTIVRGGLGIFSGRPPYVWISNAFGNTGLEQSTIICTGTNVPAFTVDPNAQPTSCGPTGPPAAATINYFDKSFRFPQDWKASFGVDHRLPWQMVGTFDFLYTRAINQFYLTDVNLQGVIASAGGEGGRPVYGTFNATTGAATAARLTSSFRQVILHENKSGDHSFSLTGQLQKRFSDNVEFNVGYTYSHTEDLFSLTSSIASSNLNFAALDGTLANRNLRTSAFDLPHKITASGSVTLPYRVNLSVIYVGQSGFPYSYTVQGDANGDGISGNDMVYVPRDSFDITMKNPADYTTLNSYINGEDCLRNNRGRLLPRNSCRNAWTNFLNARLGKVFPTVNGQSIEITADFFNVLNMISGDWGLIRQTAPFEEQAMLRLSGYDTTNNRGIYTLFLPPRNQVQINSSRWRIQLGAKYAF
jgi:carboxypeptidase family protein/TonB-dependent receptor-like protein